MGFAASQARLMALVARKSDLEMQGHLVEQSRLQLGNMVSRLFNIQARVTAADGQEAIRDGLLARLKPVDDGGFDLHWSASKNRHVAALSWLPGMLDGGAVSDWMIGANSLLVVLGEAGSGKTTLSAAVIDKVAESCRARPASPSVFAYHYFRTTSSLCDKPSTILRMILFQIVSGSIYLHQGILDRCSGLNSRSDFDGETLLAMLHDAISQRLQHTYIILDGLDDCVEKEEVASLVVAMHEWGIDGLHIMLTAREDGCCPLRPDKLASLVLSETVSVSRLPQPRDIQHRIQEGIRTEIRLTSLESALASLVTKSKERSQIQSLEDQIESEDATAKTERDDYDFEVQGNTEPYEWIHDISDPDLRSSVKQVLHLLTFAVRPLSTEELATGIITAKNDTNVAGIIKLCRSELRVFHSCEESTKTLHYHAKQSFADYLLSKQILDGPIADFSINRVDGHAKMANICIAYLCQFDREDSFRPLQLNEVPFAHYAAKHWYTHYLASGRQDLTPSAIKLLENDSIRHNWVRNFDPDWPTGEVDLGRSGHAIPGALYYASLLGLEDVVSALLLIRRPLEAFNKIEGVYGTPLQAAAARGHVGVLSLLLESGANVNASCGCYGNALCAATASGYFNAVKALLQAGAGVNVKGTGLHMRTHQAQSNTSTQVSEASGSSDSTDTPLTIAAYLGHAGIAKALICAGADINATDTKFGRTALLWATINDQLEVVEVLLTAGADPNRSDDDERTALQVSLELNLSHISDSLLEHNAEVSGNAIRASFRSLMKIDPKSYTKDKRLTSGLKGKGFQATAIEVLCKQSTEEPGIGYILRKCYSLDGRPTQTLRRQLLREREVLGSLKHPNIVQFLGYRENKQRKMAYLYMEYCDIGDLTQFITESPMAGTTWQSSRGGTQAGEEDKLYGSYESDASSPDVVLPSPKKATPVSQDQAWLMLEQVAAGLAYCHHGVVRDGDEYSLKHVWKQVLHRDIKPANVVVKTEAGQYVAKICDLGLAKVREDAEKQTLALGTLDFMPPEVKYQMQPWTAKGECFSLGATFRALAMDFEDKAWDGLLKDCREVSAIKRPSSLAILQTAREAVSRLQGKEPASTKFLKKQEQRKSYFQQVMSELLGRFFLIFKRATQEDGKPLVERIRRLHDDACETDTNQLNSNRADSVLVAVVLRDKQQIASSLASWNAGSSTECSWDTQGLTPFHLAAKNGDLEVLDILLSASASHEAPTNVRTGDTEGETAAHLAAAHNSLSCLRALLRVEKGLARFKDKRGETPLHKAAARGHLDIMKELVHAGGEIHAENKFGDTAAKLARNFQHSGVDEFIDLATDEMIEDQIKKLAMKDKELEMVLKRLDAQRGTVAAEIGSVDRVIRSNIRDTFKTMG